MFRHHLFLACFFLVLFQAAGSDQQTALRTAAPDWAANAVWYQIFPERFRNGDPANDPTRDSLETPIRPGTSWRVRPWGSDWYAREPWEKEAPREVADKMVLDRRYGGDLKGVLEKLDYLAALGVNALYFNPLFYARSLHKYDGNTYHHIDPFFGPDPQGDLALMQQETEDPATWQWTAADKLFLELVARAHERGLRVIIDGVWNHTGRDFFAFADLRKKQAASAYRDWYQVVAFDDPATPADEFDYKGWWNHKTLPVFAFDKEGEGMAPGPKAYIWAATRRWMDPNGDGDPADGIDGWRLDVADERPTRFWAAWNALVRSINPAAYTTAETWKDAARFLAEGGFSACMNYHGFAEPVKAFLIDAHLPASRFARLLVERSEAFPPAVALALQNLLDSHDTPRLATMIANRGRTKYPDDGSLPFPGASSPRETPKFSTRPPDATGRAIQRLVVLMQMTGRGAPMIYYGDEAGMWGAHDPDCRKPMVWADCTYAPEATGYDGRPQMPVPVRFDNQLFQFYQQAIALRKSQPALCTGALQVVATDDRAQTVGFVRTATGHPSLLVVLNRSPRPQTLRVPGWTVATLLLDSADGNGVTAKQAGATAQIRLPALAGAVFECAPVSE